METFRNHWAFSKYPDALQFIMYYDEIEVANPLGAKAGKHKLGMVTYSVHAVCMLFCLMYNTVYMYMYVDCRCVLLHIGEYSAYVSFASSSNTTDFSRKKFRYSSIWI